MYISINLEKALARRRMTIRELADRLGMPEHNISMLHKAELRDPRFKILEVICRELDCSPPEIFDYQRERIYD